ncbi:uncharacterized protein DNG_05267 [Cephalotrichum gorgonifer]|uniref:Uncharacterized protein n=1 Tax=Cephalotrichum gorgonifer TaxID=2041049 RepID=A0AAE8SVM0_9PEZI|nr:uncharacterized protein DNG_05267 [Cephalotrichum gorgonifer]
MLVAYVHALKCLRVLLADRVTAQTPDTLCAIYIVMLCQSWIGNPDDKLVGHSEAVVHILNCIAVNRWKGHFENQLFMTLSLSVLPESIYNPAIRPGPWFQRIVDNFSVYKTTSQKNGGPGPAVGVLTLMRLVEFVRDQQGDIGDIQAGYDAMFHQTAQARENLARMFASQGSHRNNPGNPNPMVPGGAEMEKIRLLCQAQYALLLSATMLVNGVLSAIMPSNAEIPKQVAGYPDELVELTRQTAKYKPIGSGFMPTCLLMACATTTDRSHMAKMTGALAEYGTGAMESKWGYWASQMRSQFQDMRFKMSLMRLEGSLV